MKKIIFKIVTLLTLTGGIIMADYNIQMSQRNAGNTDWDNHYPVTKAENVITSSGTVADIPQQTDIKNNKDYVNRQIQKEELSYCKVINSLGQSIESDVFTPLFFNTTIKDTNAFHTGNDSKFYINKSGFYNILVELEFASCTVGETAIRINLNGTSIIANKMIKPSGILDISANTMSYLENGDYLEVTARQQSTSLLGIYNAAPTSPYPFCMTICLITAPIESPAPMEYRGIAKVFKNKFDVLSDMGSMIEFTAINDGDQVDAWYGSGDVFYANSNDNDVTIWGKQPSAIITGCRFPYTFKYANKYYTMGVIQPTYDIYLWESTDKTTWTVLNSGNPIITHGTGAWRYLWNPSVSVIGDTLHVWIEGGSMLDQSDVGLNYTHGTLADLTSFDTNKSPNQVINGGGNPSTVYIPERNAILILHGSIFATDDLTAEKNYWTVRASYVYLDEDLDLTASYIKTTKEQFYIYEANKHICDPQILELPASKTSRLLLFYSYGQTALYQTYADVSMLELFDALSN